MNAQEQAGAESGRGGRVWLMTLAALGMVAFIIRLAFIHSLRASPFFDLLVSDSAVYDAWARRIAAGEWLTEAGFFQAPLYPFFLAAHYWIFGEGLMAVRVTQAVLGAASCALIAEAGRRIFNPRAGLIAGVLLAIYPPAIFFDAQIHKPSLDLFLMSALILGAAMVAKRSWGAPAITGVSLGLLMLTRENALLLVPLMGLFHGIVPASALRRKLLAVAVFLFALLIPHLLFGTWRTLPLIGTRAEKASIGLPFYMGNRHGASGMYEPLAGDYGNPSGEWRGARKLAEREAGHAMSAAEISSFWTRKALSDIRDHPISWIGLIARKALMTWNRVELSDVLDFRSHADHAPWLGWMAAVLNFGILAPLAVWGAWIRRAEWRRWWILGAMAFVFSASVVLFYVSARYRYPLVPVLAVLAAAGLDGARASMLQSTARARLIAISIFIAALVLANLPAVPAGFSEHQHSFSYYNAGVGWAAKGRDGTAIGCLNRALEIMPDNEPALFNLGEALERGGEYEEAIKVLARALKLRGDRAATYAALARCMTGLGRPAEAEPFIKRALELAPDDPEIRAIAEMTNPARME